MASAQQARRVALYLDDDEADTLADILAHVAGFPSKSRRRYSDAVLHVLRAAGVAGRGDHDMHPSQNRIEFSPE